LRNPSNNTVVSIVNSTSTADTTINILALGGGGGNVGLVGVTAEETRTDSTLVDDGYLIATMAGTTDHDYAYGGIYTGSFDLYLYGNGSGLKFWFGFELPDTVYSVLNTTIDYWKTQGIGTGATKVTTYAANVAHKAKQYIQSTSAGYHTLKISYYLDNQYGYTGPLKFMWGSTQGTMEPASRMIAYRLK
jgi:hypothetical protein